MAWELYVRRLISANTYILVLKLRYNTENICLSVIPSRAKMFLFEFNLLSLQIPRRLI